jgi:hypothetical protein
LHLIGKYTKWRTVVVEDPTKHNPENAGSRRDAEERPKSESEHKRREKTLDKTIADSFPTSDPPSTIPDPEEDEDAA